MTRLALISDSHGNNEYVSRFLGAIKDDDVDAVWHLGDFYADAESIIDAGYACIRVPGTWTPYYENSYIDNRRFETVKGWTFFLTHTPTRHYNDLPEDVDPQTIIDTKQADVFLHGHTHQPTIKIDNAVIIINPGHTKSSFDAGQPPSYGICDIDENQLRIRLIHLLDQTILNEATFIKGEVL